MKKINQNQYWRNAKLYFMRLTKAHEFINFIPLKNILKVGISVLVLFFTAIVSSYAQYGDISGTSTAKTLKIGGGGWMTGMHINPSGTPVVARTDVGTPVIWNEATKTWTNLVTTKTMPAGYALDNLDVGSGKNSFGGAVSVVSDPSNGNTLYMAYSDTKNNWQEGCIFKSTDQGKNWSVTGLCGFTALPNTDGPKTQGEKLCVDPNNPNVVYFGSSAQGLYRTDNGGTAWNTVSDVSKGDESIFGIGMVIIDGSSGTTTRNGVTVTKNVYATLHNKGVYQSTDGGATFHLMTGYTVGRIDDAEVVNNVLVIASNKEVWKYKNGTWTNISSGTSSVVEVALDPNNTDRIFAFSEGGGTIYRTTDGGATGFQTINRATTATDVPWLAWIDTGWLSVGAVQFDPKTSGELWFAEGTGMWRSTEITGSTLTWNNVSAGIENMVANDVVAPPGGVPITAFWDQKLFYKDNLDTYPTEKKPNKVFGSCWDLDYVEKNPLQIVALIDDHTGSHAPARSSGYSLDGGKTWNMFSALSNGTAPSGMQYGNMAVSSNNLDNIVWLPSSKGMPYYTKDRGATWYQVNEGSNSTDGGHHAYYSNKEVLQSDRVTDGTFYIYNWNYGFYKSTNGGESWVQSANNPPLGAWNAIVRTVPGKAGHLFWASGYNSKKPLYHSVDGGDTWTKSSNVDATYMIALGKTATNASYPTLFLYGIINGQEGLFRSTDEGANWDFVTAAVDGSFDTPTAMDGDKDIYGRVYIGYTGSSFKYVDANGTSTVTTVTKGNGTGITGSYFNSIDLTGTPVVRNDDNISFDWSTNGPAVGSLGTTNFSVRWTGKIEAPVDGSYTFRTYSDDGIRVWINGTKIIDAWIDQGAGNPNVSTAITLSANTKYDIKVEYYQGGGAASAKLEWNYPGHGYTGVPKDRLYPDGTVSTVSVTGVAVNPTSTSIAVNGTQQLTATVSPSNASNSSVSWSSSNTSVATVGSSGLVTGVAAGSATITATTSDGSFKSTSSITVSSGSSGGGTAVNLASNKTASANSEQTGNEASKGNDGNNSTRWAANDGSFPKTWSVDLGSNYTLSKIEIDWEVTASTYYYKVETSIDNNIWTIALDKSSNTVQGHTSEAINVSSAKYVRVTTVGYTGGYAWASFYECRVFGTSGSATSTTIAVTGVAVSPGSTSIALNNTQQLTATVSPSNASNSSVSWTSSNTSVATVSSSGLVTGVAAGSATITAITSDGSFKSTSSITVTAASSTPLSISITSPANNQTITPGSDLNIQVNVTGNVAKVYYWYDNWVWLSSVTSSPWSTKWNNVPAGTHTIMAMVEDVNGKTVYANNITFVATNSSALGITITSPTNNQTIAAGSDLNIQVNVTGNVAKVYYWYDNWIWLNSTTSSPWSTKWSNVPAGSHTITARVEDVNGNTIDAYEIKFVATSSGRLAGVKGKYEIKQLKSILSPNPAEKEVTVVFNASEVGSSNISIIDMNGNVVYKTTASGTSATLNISALRQGMYIVRVINENFSSVEKLIVQ